MKQADLLVIGEAVGALLKERVSVFSDQILALEKEIAELKAREPEKGEPGPPGEVGPKGEAGPKGEDGRDGTQGLPGRDGRDGDNGKDGQSGVNGKDGLDFTEAEGVLHEDGRTVTIKFARGDLTKELKFSFPVVLDKGVFKEGTNYEAGDAVSFGGSLWICQKSTQSKPQGSWDWRLAVKSGRDGKDFTGAGAAANTPGQNNGGFPRVRTK